VTPAVDPFLKLQGWAVRDVGSARVDVRCAVAYAMWSTPLPSMAIHASRIDDDRSAA
jgi:hypothetical protein